MSRGGAGKGCKGGRGGGGGDLCLVTGDFLMMTSWMACYCTKPTSRS